MKKVVIITNIPSPYRVDFFYYLQTHYEEYQFHILYSSRNEDNRKWDIDGKKMLNSHFLPSFTIKIKKRYDNKYIHIPRDVKKMLQKLKPDVVVGSEYNPTVIQAVRYCKKNRIPYVSWTDGTLYSERNINKLQRYLRKYVVSRADAYIASSSKSKEAQIHYGAREDKISVSYLTIDIEKYVQEPRGTGKGQILYVGSLIERKGVDLLFKALACVSSSYTLILAGDGPEKERLQKQAEQLGIAERVQFAGYLDREQLLQYYAESDLFVLPTREDCFALVILEAMCSGLPVICSRYADGVYDLIEDGKNGLVVDPAQTGEFGEKIELLLRDKTLQKGMREASKKVVHKFSFEKVADEFVKAIQKAKCEEIEK